MDFPVRVHFEKSAPCHPGKSSLHHCAVLHKSVVVCWPETAPPQGHWFPRRSRPRPNSAKATRPQRRLENGSTSYCRDIKPASSRRSKARKGKKQKLTRGRQRKYHGGACSDSTSTLVSCSRMAKQIAEMLIES